VDVIRAHNEIAALVDGGYSMVGWDWG